MLMLYIVTSYIREYTNEHMTRHARLVNEKKNMEVYSFKLQKQFQVASTEN